jgi:hypothetical protein
VGGAAFLLTGLVASMAAANLFLIRLRTPMDVAFCLVALSAIVTGWLLVRSAMHALSPHRLVPTRSLSQISSVLGRS